MKTHRSISNVIAATIFALTIFSAAALGQTPAKTDGAKIKSMLADLRNSQYSASVVASDWTSLWNPAFDQTWVSKSGRTTSQLLSRLVTKQEHPLHSIIKNGEEDWAKDPSLKSSVIGLQVLCTAIFADAPTVNPNAPAQFPSVLAARQDEMPVTLGDVLTCRIVEDTLFLSQTHPTLPPDQTAAWVRLAQAKNPIYRLIAVRGFSYFTTTSDQAQAFYAALATETEPAINKVVTQSLSGRTDQWAVAMLPQVKAKLPPPSN